MSKYLQGRQWEECKFLKRFFKSDVTSAEKLKHGNMHKEAEQVKMWLQ
jgi:hypothetical protein